MEREFLIVKRSALTGFANDLERGYKEKEVRKQVLRGRAICSDDLLNRERTLQEKGYI